MDIDDFAPDGTPPPSYPTTPVRSRKRRQPDSPHTVPRTVQRYRRVKQEHKGFSFYNRKRNYRTMPRRKYSKRRSVLIARPDDTEARIARYSREHSATTGKGTEYSIGRYGPTWNSATTDQKTARMTDRFYGRGDYNSLPWYGRVGHFGLRGLGAAAGGLFGNARAGHDFGAAASKWMGWGKYRRRGFKGRGDYGGDAGGNQIMGSTGVQVPISVNASETDLSGDIFISHTEFVQNIQAVGAAGNISTFNLVSFPLNVGMVQTFPWLAQISQNFTLYEPAGLIFEYRPTSGEFGVTGNNALGKVIMATEYDPDAPVFTSSVQMENYDYATSCKPSERMLHGVETAPKSRAVQMLYIRTGNTAKDRVFTDIGNFMIATEGLPITSGTTSNIGELWVTYKVRLSRANLFGSLVGNDITQDTFFGESVGSTSVMDNTATYIASQSFAARYNLSGLGLTLAAPRVTNTLGGTFSSGSKTAANYQFPPNIVAGTYFYTLILNVPSAVAAYQIIPTATSFCSLISAGGLYGAPATAFWDSPGSGTSISNQVTGLVRVIAPGNNQALITFSWTNAVLTGTQITLTVIQVPDSLDT